MKYKNKTSLYYIILILILISFFLFDSTQICKKDRSISKNHTINFLNVGQGDSTLIQSPDGIQVLIDGGPSYDELKKQLNKLMPQADHTIEVVILTHPDKDHLNGLLKLVDDYKIKMIIDNQMDKDTKLYQEWEHNIQKTKTKRIEGYAGEKLSIQNSNHEDIIEIEILSPLSQEFIQSQNDINENSIITKIGYRELTFLLTGDAGKDIENLISELYQQDYMDIDIVKAGHHGSKNSTSKNFVEIISPAYSIISVGDNSYGHPDDEVIKILSESKILRTDEYGNISFILREDDFNIKCEETDCGGL